MDSSTKIAFLLAMVAAIQDLMQYRISNNLTYPAILAGLIWHTWCQGWPGFASSGYGIAIAFACLFPIFLVRGFGAGDVKLFMALGAWLGPRSIVNVLLISLTMNGCVSAAIMIARRSNSPWIGVVGHLCRKAFAAIGLGLNRGIKYVSTSSESKPVEKIPLAVIVLFGMIAVFHFGMVIL